MQALASIFLLGGSSTQLQAVYDAKKGKLQSWSMSPFPIHSMESREEHLGDARFQRAYMDHFSLQHVRKGSRQTIQWAASNLIATTGGKQLLYGLFAGFGQSLFFLSDGMEIPSALMIVQALTLAAVDWHQKIQDFVVACAFPQHFHGPDRYQSSPTFILQRVGEDGRFSGLRGPGVESTVSILSDPRRKAAIMQHVGQLDVSDINTTLCDLSHLSILAACATHKRGQPAFDRCLALFPAFVVSLRVLLKGFEEPDAGFGAADRITLVRGIWMLIVVAYIRQLRPKIDDLVVPMLDNPPSWEQLLAGFHRDSFSASSVYQDARFLRLLRSIRRLAEDNDLCDSAWYRRMAAHLINNWCGWSGEGHAQDEYLNVRV